MDPSGREGGGFSQLAKDLEAWARKFFKKGQDGQVKIATGKQSEAIDMAENVPKIAENVPKIEETVSKANECEEVGGSVVRIEIPWSGGHIMNLVNSSSPGNL